LVNLPDFCGIIDRKSRARNVISKTFDIVVRLCACDTQREREREREAEGGGVTYPEISFMATNLEK
jgi:hypothetical protein